MSELRVTLAAAEAAVEQMIDDIQDLVERQSPSTDPAALLRSARGLATLAERLTGLPARILDDDGVPHVLVDGGGSRAAGRRVLLLCHHDTVWPTGSWGPAPFTRQSDTLAGPGAFDMKAGLAQGLHALNLLRAAGVPLDGVRLLATGDEEVGSASSRALIEAQAVECDAVLVLEPSAAGGALKTERKGVAIYKLVCEGRAAHAGLEPEKGVNATLEAALQALAVARLGETAVGTTVTPTALHSGTGTNTIPALAQLDIDARAWSLAELKRVDAALRSLAPALPGSQLRLDGGINRPPLEAPSSYGLYEMGCLVARELGIPAPGAAAVGGASDGNFTAGVGVPTLDGLGAVGDGAHAVGEHVLIPALAQRTALTAGLIQRLLEGAAL